MLDDAPMNCRFEGMRMTITGTITRGTRTVVAAIGALVAAVSIAAGGPASFSVSSAAFSAGARVPEEYTCSGANHSPALQWSGAPAGVKEYALIVADPDAPSGTFIHWVAYNIPSSVTSLPEGVAVGKGLAGGGIQGANGAGRKGYFGPCPPPGSDHHYHFQVFALDAPLNAAPDLEADALESAMKGHVIGTAELVGVYSR